MTLLIRVPCPGWADIAQNFVELGWLTTGDVHVVDTVAAALDIDWTRAEAAALLGLAFAVRAPREGHVGVDLSTVQETAVLDRQRGQGAQASPPAPRWPPADGWSRQVAGLDERLLAQVARAEQSVAAPFILHGSLLYLHRMYFYQAQVAQMLMLRATDNDPPT